MIQRTGFFGAFLCALVLAQSSFSQSRLTGQVVDVIDGRTAVIDVSGTRLDIVLQLIDVPEPGQKLSSEVTEHLRALIAKKTVEFKVRTTEGDRSVGTIFLNGVDIGQQMLRDGGAWLLPVDMTDAEAPERDMYTVAESQARADKLGVWSVPGLKPAWEFRAEQRSSTRPGDTYRYSPLGDPSPGRPRNPQARANGDADLSLWADIMNAGRDAGGLVRRKLDDSGVRMTATNATVLELSSGKLKQKLSIRAIYASRGLAQGKDEMFVIGLQAVAKTSRLTQAMPASITAEDKLFTLGPARRFVRQNYSDTQEIFFYIVTRNTLNAIAGARTTEVVLGPFTGSLDIESQTQMLQLLDAAH
ncbi:MAG: thermonuclease family protein [Acidobacteriota bacterium]